MLSFLDKLPYSILIVFSVIMILIPFSPMPHFVEKLIMLKNGTLNKPIDIFDLFYHSAPLILLIIKFIRDYSNRWNGSGIFIYLETETTGKDEDMTHTFKHYLGIWPKIKRARPFMPCPYWLDRLFFYKQTTELPSIIPFGFPKCRCTMQSCIEMHGHPRSPINAPQASLCTV